MNENNDIRLMIGDVKFSSRAVAVIEHDGKILFQKRKNDANWALPGGAIATMEKGEEVVQREIFEETGEPNAMVKRPLWFVEYFFEFGGITNHQYIIGYLVDLPTNSILYERETFDGIEIGKNIIYQWFPTSQLEDTPIKPDFLKKKLVKIKKNFEFVSETDK